MFDFCDFVWRFGCVVFESSFFVVLFEGRMGVV